MLRRDACLPTQRLPAKPSGAHQQLTVATCKHLLHQVGVRVIHRHKPTAGERERE